MSTAKKLEVELDAKAEMELYKKAGVPGEEHKILEKMAGSWSTVTKSWSAPDKAPIESLGVCVQELILGGRFLKQECSGDMMGTEFTGIGFTGYDNVEKKYVSTWMDSLGTAIYVFEGKADPGGRCFTQTCSHVDPVRGPMKWRSVCAVKDENTMTFVMYGAPVGGKEEKMMEMTYTRRK